MGNNIARYRKELGKSQEELATEVGITRPYLSYLENCKKSPSYAIAFKIAKALNKKPDEIFFEPIVNHGEQQNNLI